ncbi:MAG: DUF4142 domain-containing protein [Pirellulales bacterium]
MRTFTFKVFTAVASIGCLPLVLAAQQPPAGQPEANATVQSTTPQNGVNQNTGIVGPNAGQHGPQMGQGPSLTAFIVHKLRLGNQGEVELGQMATERAEHQQVKQFAQKMVQEHSQMIQKLDAIQGAGGQPGTPNPNQNPNSNSGAQNPPTQPNVQGQPNTPGRPNNGESIVGRVNPNQGPEMNGVQVPAQIAAMSDRHCQIKLQLTKQLLQQHQGKDFEMAYLGQQIAAHMDMLAELQAIQSASAPQLQQLVSQAEKSTKEHLEMAKSICKELEGDKKDGHETKSGLARGENRSDRSNNERSSDKKDRDNSSEKKDQ